MRQQKKETRQAEDSHEIYIDQSAANCTLNGELPLKNDDFLFKKRPFNVKLAVGTCGRAVELDPAVEKWSVSEKTKGIDSCAMVGEQNIVAPALQEIAAGWHFGSRWLRSLGAARHSRTDKPDNGLVTKEQKIHTDTGETAE